MCIRLIVAATNFINDSDDEEQRGTVNRVSTAYKCGINVSSSGIVAYLQYTMSRESLCPV
jgi:hypothetical protein